MLYRFLRQIHNYFVKESRASDISLETGNIFIEQIRYGKIIEESKLIKLHSVQLMAFFNFETPSVYTRFMNSRKIFCYFIT